MGRAVRPTTQAIWAELSDQGDTKVMQTELLPETRPFVPQRESDRDRDRDRQTKREGGLGGGGEGVAEGEVCMCVCVGGGGGGGGGLPNGSGGTTPPMSSADT